jgi:hypothetical protein
VLFRSDRFEKVVMLSYLTFVQMDGEHMYLYCRHSFLLSSFEEKDPLETLKVPDFGQR